MFSDKDATRPYGNGLLLVAPIQSADQCDVNSIESAKVSGTPCTDGLLRYDNSQTHWSNVYVQFNGNGMRTLMTDEGDDVWNISVLSSYTSVIFSDDVSGTNETNSIDISDGHGANKIVTRGTQTVITPGTTRQ